MKISSATFVKSSTKLSQLPAPTLPEYGFVGRSNVGKSSLINMLLQRKNLARTSSTPGKTQEINHFLINEAWYLVDLPGYGYARTSKKQRDQFAIMINDYLKGRENLMNTFILVDSRHQPQALDLEFMESMGLNGLPFTIVYTKTDKLNRYQLESNLQVYRDALLETWEDMPPMVLTSATKGRGREELLNHIEDINDMF
ncbi:MAG: ribosome biogenesis GTP-binding protein YihA/YsxC [Bacteroidota bacterium]